MIDIDEYEKMTPWGTPSDELADAIDDLLAEVKRLNALIHNNNNWLKLNHPKVFDEMMMSKLFGGD